MGKKRDLEEIEEWLDNREEASVDTTKKVYSDRHHTHSYLKGAFQNFLRVATRLEKRYIARRAKEVQNSK